MQFCQPGPSPPSTQRSNVVTGGQVQQGQGQPQQGAAPTVDSNGNPIPVANPTPDNRSPEEIEAQENEVKELKEKLAAAEKKLADYEANKEGEAELRVMIEDKERSLERVLMELSEARNDKERYRRVGLEL